MANIKKTVDLQENIIRLEEKEGDKFVEGEALIPFGKESYIERMAQKGQRAEVKEGKTEIELDVNRENDVNLYIAKTMLTDWSKKEPINEHTVYGDTELVVGLKSKGKPKKLIKEYVEEVKKINGIVEEDLDYEEEIENLFNDAGVDAEEYREDIDNMVDVLEAGRDAKN